MNQKNAIDCVLVQLKPGQWEILQAALIEEGYEATGKGVGLFLMDMLTEDVEEETGRQAGSVNPALQKLFKYFANNPELVKKAATMSKTAAYTFLKKKMGL